MVKDAVTIFRLSNYCKNIKFRECQNSKELHKKTIVIASIDFQSQSNKTTREEKVDNLS